MSFKKIEADLNGRPRLQGAGKLISMPTNAEYLTLNNAKKTAYKVVQLEIEPKPGVTKIVNAMIFKANIDRAVEDNSPIEVGKSYLCTVTAGTEGRGPIVQMSHLTSGSSVSNADFGFEDFADEASVEELEAAQGDEAPE